MKINYEKPTDIAKIIRPKLSTFCIFLNKPLCKIIQNSDRRKKKNEPTQKPIDSDKQIKNHEKTQSSTNQPLLLRFPKHTINRHTMRQPRAKIHHEKVYTRKKNHRSSIRPYLCLGQDRTTKPPRLITEHSQHITVVYQICDICRIMRPPNTYSRSLIDNTRLTLGRPRK